MCDEILVKRYAIIIFWPHTQERGIIQHLPQDRLKL